MVHQFKRVEQFKGSGSRINRVHIFDKRYGTYLTRGYIKGEILFIKDLIDLKGTIIRSFKGD